MTNKPHQISDISNDYTRITPADNYRQNKSQELMEIIQQGISPLPMQTKRDVLCAVRLLLKLK